MAVQALHLLVAGLERTAESRLYVSELRRLTLRALLDVVSAGMASTERGTTYALTLCKGRIAKVSAVLGVMASALPKMTASVLAADELCCAVGPAFKTFAAELEAESAVGDRSAEPTAIAGAEEGHEPRVTGPVADPVAGIVEPVAGIVAPVVGIDGPVAEPVAVVDDAAQAASEVSSTCDEQEGEALAPAELVPATPQSEAPSLGG